MTMGSEWLRRAERIAQARARALAEQAEAALRAIDGIDVERLGGEIRVRGRALARRWLHEPALRFLAWLLK